MTWQGFQKRMHSCRLLGGPVLLALLGSGCLRNENYVSSVVVTEVTSPIPIARPKETPKEAEQTSTTDNEPAGNSEEAATDVSAREETACSPASIPLDEPSILQPEIVETVEWNCPILIHQTASPVIAAPCELLPADEQGSEFWTQRASYYSCNRCRTVVLKKVSGDSVGTLFVAPIRKGQAAFQSLTAGAYDVFYCPESASELQDVSLTELPAWSDRRIIVEPEPVTAESEDLVQLVAAETMVGVSADALQGTNSRQIQDLDRLLESIRQRGRSAGEQFVRVRHPDSSRAWSLLAKRSTFGAIRTFDSIIVDELRRQCEPSEEASERSPRLTTIDCQLGELLSATESSIESLRRRKIHVPVAIELAALAKGNVRLAEAFYGLAKCYDAISQETNPLVLGAEHLAIVLYAAAFEVDSAQRNALNDLGVLCFRCGWSEEAIGVLTAVCEGGPFPAAEFNLSQIYARTGQPDESESLIEAAIAADGRCLPAVLASIESQASTSSAALYAEDYRRFAGRIALVAQMHTDDRARQMAQEMLERLELIGREIRLNHASLHEQAVLAESRITLATWTRASSNAPDRLELDMETAAEERSTADAGEAEDLEEEAAATSDLPAPPPVKVVHP